MNVKTAAFLIVLIFLGCASAPLPTEFQNNKSIEDYEKSVVSIYCSNDKRFTARGTAFFFNPSSLLAAKHSFKNKKPENCYISFLGVLKLDVKRIILSPNSDIAIVEIDYQSDNYLEPTLYWQNTPPKKWLNNVLYAFPALVLARDNSFLTWRKGENRIIFSQNQKRNGLEVFITNEKDAMIRPGFSGSPVLGKNGELTGMVISMCELCAAPSLSRSDWPGFMLMISWHDLQYYFPEKFR